MSRAIMTSFNIHQFEKSLRISHVSCLVIFTFSSHASASEPRNKQKNWIKTLRIGNFSHYCRFRIILTINQQKESLKWKQIRLRKHNKLLIHTFWGNKKKGNKTFNYCGLCLLFAGRMRKSNSENNNKPSLGA